MSATKVSVPLDNLIEVAKKLTAFDEAVALLREYENQYDIDPNGNEVTACCREETNRHHKDVPHRPDCRLAAFLKKWGKK